MAEILMRVWPGISGGRPPLRPRGFFLGFMGMIMTSKNKKTTAICRVLQVRDVRVVLRE